MPNSAPLRISDARIIWRQLAILFLPVIFEMRDAMKHCSIRLIRPLFAFAGVPVKRYGQNPPLSPEAEWAISAS